jgi:tight adherence protein B
MFDAGTVTTAIAILAALSISGLAYALLSPLMAREDKKERINKVAVIDRRAAHAQLASEEDAASRRKNIASKLKQQQDVIDEKTKKNASSKAPLNVRIKRAGLTWSIRHFWMVSGISGLFMYGLLFGMGAPLYAALAAGAVGFLGLPSWYVNYKA